MSCHTYKRAFSLLVAIAAVLFLSQASLAATYYVPDNFGTIQEALDGASAGDTIIVRDGTYTGANNRDLNFGGKALTLRSENGAASYTIDCENLDRGFTFINGETSTSVVDGFTITNGNAGSGGGVHCYAASPIIINCIISNCTAGNAAGIYCYDSSAVISGCTITGNTATASAFENGGGIWLSSSSPTIVNCTITDNSAGDDGGGLWCANSSVDVINCIISMNDAGRNCGGAYLNASSTTITDSIIFANTAVNDGGGIGFFSCPTANATNCLIVSNSAARGGAIVSSNSTPTIANSTSSGNAATEGGALFCHSSTPTFIDSILYSDTAPTGAELAIRGSSTVTVTYSNVQGGQAAAYVEASSTLVWGPAGMNHDPMFVSAPMGNYYLSHVATGQAMTSMCVDAGSDTAANLGLGTYTTRTDHVGDIGTVDVGYHSPSAVGSLTRITCMVPANESLVSSAPTFMWIANGGTDNRYAVDLAPSLSGPVYTSPVLSSGYWSMPQAWWDFVPSGSYVYYRVRGADLDQTPLTIITSDELWWFYKL